MSYSTRTISSLKKLAHRILIFEKEFLAISIIRAVRILPLENRHRLRLLGKFHESLAVRYSREMQVKDIAEAKVKEWSTFKRLRIRDIAPVRRKLLQPSLEKSIPLPKVVDIVGGGSINLICPEISLIELDDVEFFVSSDILRQGDICIWDKADDPRFTKVVPLDEDLISYDSENIVARNYTTRVHRVKLAFSLCGVHVKSWGHFLGNFMAKLEALQLIEDKQGLVLIVPEEVDSHVKEVVQLHARRNGIESILYAARGEKVQCIKLFYCTLTSWIPDHLCYLQDHDIVISDYSLESMRKLAASLESSITTQHKNRRLFICRNGARNLMNYSKVESFFHERGFELIEPHNMTLLEKAKAFAEASHIVGPTSSGMSNIIFCKPQTKVMNLACFPRVYDLYYTALLDYFDLNGIILTGHETPSADIHKSFMIPLQKIERVIGEIDFMSEP